MQSFKYYLNNFDLFISDVELIGYLLKILKLRRTKNSHFGSLIEIEKVINIY